MATQVFPLLDPARGAFWALVAPLAAVLIVAGVALLDHLREPHRDPAGVMAVYSLRTARRALARVGRLDLESSTAGGAAYRHLMAVRTWASSERHYGTRRRQAAVTDLLADASAQLDAMGRGPGGSATVRRIVEPRDGALAGPNRYADDRVPEVPLLQALSRRDSLIVHVDKD